MLSTRMGKITLSIETIVKIVSCGQACVDYGAFETFTN